MSISQLILNDVIQMDVTNDTVTASTLLSGAQATGADGEKVFGNIQLKTSADLTVSGATVTVPAGHYASQATKSIASGSVTQNAPTINSSTGVVTATSTITSGYVAAGTKSNTLSITTESGKTITPTLSEQTAVAAGRYTTGAIKVAAMPSGTAGTPTASKGTVSNHSVTITPTVTNSTGYITGGTKNGTAVTVTASELVGGRLEITENDTDIDVTNYSVVDVYVTSQDTPSAVERATPTITVGSDGLITASVTQAAGFVTAGTKTATEQLSTQAAITATPTTSEQTIVTAGKYTTGAIKVAAMPSGTAGTPTASKSAVSNHSVTVTPSVTNATGYITGGTKSGTAVTVTASELVSGTKTITANEEGVDVTNYASVNVSVALPGAVEQATPVVTINTATGLVTATATQLAGTVPNGTKSGTLQLTTQAAKTVTPTTSEQTAVAANSYTTGVVKVAAMPSGTAGTPVATIGTVANHAVSITPSVTNVSGYITGGVISGSPVTVSASDLVSGTLDITQNGLIDVSNYQYVYVQVFGPLDDFYLSDIDGSSIVGSAVVGSAIVEGEG